MKKEVISAKEAAALVKDNMTISLTGFIGFSIPEDILCKLEQRFLTEHSPKDLTLFYAAGIAGDGKKRGVNHLGHKGLLKKLYCANNSLGLNMSNQIANNSFPAFMAPQGVLLRLYRAIAAGEPGVITHVGLKTFVDPRVEGGAVNEKAKKSGEKVSELIKLRGKEYLFHPSFPIDLVFIKGTTADEDGNITINREAMKLEQFELAAAAKNSGGIVVAQVDNVVLSGSLNAKDVVVPGKLIDYLVLGDPDNSRQHYTDYEEGRYIPSWSGELKVTLPSKEILPLSKKKIISRRGAFELKKGGFINLGIGIPTAITNVASEEGILKNIILNTESGVIGGAPTPGLATGASYNPESMIRQIDMFDLYDGGGIDLAFLGAAEIDRLGNVNVSKYKGKVTGPGGFIDITQNAKKVCFLASFTAGKMEIQTGDGSLKIISDGTEIKFVNNVEQITFSGEYARENNKEVYYITERAVFKLEKEGLTLIEIAPGVNLQRDVFDKMEFRPLVSDELKEMDNRIFTDKPMNLEIE